MSDNKTARAELIAALVTDRFSGFKDGDEALLETCSDARLDEFRAASDARRASAAAYTRLETDNRNTTARLKVAEDKVKISEAELSEEDFLARAPQRIKALIEAHTTEEAATKAALVSQLKDLGAHSEEELKKKGLDELKTLAAYARVNVPDFSGRGVVHKHASERPSYTPPNPYEKPLEQLRTKGTH